MAELRPYNPTWRDRIAQVMMGDGRPSQTRRQFVEGMTGSTGVGGTGIGLADFVPGGQVFAAQEAASQGDGQGAAVAMMPVPGAAKARQLAGAMHQAPRSIPGKPDTVSIPGTGTVEAAPIAELQDSADSYMRRIGRDGEHRIDAYPEFNEDRARAIAQAFEAMKHQPGNREVRRAYDAMIDETLAQYESLKGTGLDIQFIPPGQADPYAASPAMGYADMIENGHLWTFPTESGFGTLNDVHDNPLLKRVGKIGDKGDATANDAFRVVHDAYGHFAPGNPFFRHKGEERAWINHSKMYSPEARGAMTSETRGQNSWLNFGPYAEQNRTASGADTVFADQKIGLLPQWAQEIAGKYGMAGLAALPPAVQMALQARMDEGEGAAALGSAMERAQ